jgi:hypothetical protein
MPAVQSTCGACEAVKETEPLTSVDKSMEQQVRDLLEEYAGDRTSVLEQIEASWDRQARRPSAGEIDDWIATGRK